MKTKYDIAGRRFGNLEVIGRAESRIWPGGSRASRWEVKCDCGNIKVVLYVNLWKGNTKTCGAAECPYHLARVRRGYAPGVAGLSRTWRGYKKHAKEKKIEVSLTLDQAIKIFKSDCYYCGSPPNNFAKMSTDSKNGSSFYSGIDRINSKRGYIPGNVRPCCWDCNRMKGSMKEKDFIEHAEKMLKYIKKKKRRLR